MLVMPLKDVTRKMCGFAGVFSRCDSVSADYNSILELVGDAIQHRGPDASGVWVDSARRVGFVHRRLSIQDLSLFGAQPMISFSGRYVIAFNGEIYNFQNLKSKCIKNGYTFKGHSDTEVMLAAFDIWGIEKALEQFCGMFSFAVLDRESNQLVLARDRMGEKPLYYGWVGTHFVFGSELKALQGFPFWSGEINRNALTLLLRHNYIPTPHSIYKNIYKLLPASFLRIDLAQAKCGNLPTPDRYWELEGCFDSDTTSVITADSASNMLDKLLHDVISEQMISDVPLGAFLSGGVDSSTVVAIMQQLATSKTKTFTIGFENKTFNEAIYAKKVANYLSTEHTELYVTAKDALDVIPKLPTMYDEPFADSSQIPTYLVAAMTREHVTVALSGDGGDELFCGYSRFFSTKKMWDNNCSKKGDSFVSGMLSGAIHYQPLVLAKLIKILASSQRHLSVGEIAQKLQRKEIIGGADSLHEFYRQMISYWNKPEDLVIGASEPTYSMSNPPPAIVGDNSYKQLMWQDLNCYLPDDILTKVDRAAMACSLETRIPLLDRRIVEFALQLPVDLNVNKGQGKQVLRDVLYRYVPKNLIEREKQGFAVPVGHWLRHELKDWAEALLAPRRLAEEGYWNVVPIRRKWEDHCAGRGNHEFTLWGVLMFQAWKNSIITS
jgi:asparagine synthase (glutamine-hydrolysing)